MKKLRIILITAASCLFSCCGEPTLDIVGMIDGQSPDANVRFSEGDGGGLILGSGPRTVSSPTAGYRVYVGADMHIDSNASTAHTDAFIEAYATDGDAPMALLLGDLVNGKYSMKTASDRVREKAGPKAASVFSALGNHDIYFKLWEQWAAEWGESHYSVQVSTPEGTDLYICLDSASGRLGSKQLEWLKELFGKVRDGQFRHIIVFTHTHMFKKDGSQGHTSNYPIEETWELTSLFARNGVELFISGHSHCRDISYFNGVKYVVVDALEEHYPDSETGYMVLEAGERLECRFIGSDDKQQP